MVIGISCSPRLGSNSTEVLLRALDESGVDHQAYGLNDMNMRSCSCCESCKGDVCVHGNATDANGLWERIAHKDTTGVVFSTPVHFGLPSELFVRFACRGRFIRHRNFAARNKAVGIIAIGGRRNGGQESTILSAWLPFIRQGMIPVGNGDKTSQYGAKVWGAQKGSAMDDEWGMEQAVDLCRRVASVGEALKHVKDDLKFSKTSGMPSDPRAYGDYPSND